MRALGVQLGKAGSAGPRGAGPRDTFAQVRRGAPWVHCVCAKASPSAGGPSRLTRLGGVCCLPCSHLGMSSAPTCRTCLRCGRWVRVCSCLWIHKCLWVCVALCKCECGLAYEKAAQRSGPMLAGCSGEDSESRRS